MTHKANRAFRHPQFLRNLPMRVVLLVQADHHLKTDLMMSQTRETFQLVGGVRWGGFGLGSLCAADLFEATNDHRITGFGEVVDTKETVSNLTSL